MFLGQWAAQTLTAFQTQERESDLGELAYLRQAGLGLSLVDPPPCVTVQVCSWNLYGQSISEADDLGGILLPESLGATTEGVDVVPDVVVVGLQELVSINPAACLMKVGGDFAREDE